MRSGLRDGMVSLAPSKPTPSAPDKAVIVWTLPSAPPGSIRDMSGVSTTAPRKEPVMEPKDSHLYVTALAKGLVVLSMFSAAKPSMTLRELTEATGLNKSTIQRSLFTLETMGYLVRKHGSKAYSLGVKSLEIGSNYLQTSQLIERVNPYLHELNRQTQESCNLLEPAGTEMVYVSRFASHKQISLHVPIGQRLPMYCTAAGRAYLASLPLEDAAIHIANSDRKAFTANTVTDADQLLELLKRARNDGFAFSNEEVYVGDLAVAASIVNSDGQPLAAINVAVPFSRWHIDHALAELAPKVVNAARAISSTTRALKPVPAGRA